MKFTFGKLNEDGSKKAFLRKGNEKIFVCWYHTKLDKIEGKTPTHALCQMIYKAGYNGLEDYWNTNKHKIEGGK